VYRKREVSKMLELMHGSMNFGCIFLT